MISVLKLTIKSQYLSAILTIWLLSHDGTKGLSNGRLQISLGPLWSPFWTPLLSPLKNGTWQMIRNQTLTINAVHYQNYFCRLTMDLCIGLLRMCLVPFGALWTPLVPLLDPTPHLRMAHDKWLAFAFTNWPLMVHFYRTKAPSNGLLRILLRPLWSPFWTPLCFPLLKMARDKWFAIKNCLAVRCFCLLHTES